MKYTLDCGLSDDRLHVLGVTLREAAFTIAMFQKMRPVQQTVEDIDALLVRTEELCDELRGAAHTMRHCIYGSEQSIPLKVKNNE